MPRNGATNLYYIPPGTEGFVDTTIESEKYNNYIHDVEDDLNRPRPIVAGGTGANNAADALSNLGGEKSSQQISNYDQDIFYPGSFYSLIGATGAPGIPTAPAGQTALHPFVGWVVSSDPPVTPPANKNVVVHARRQDDTKVPGTLYVREKKVDATHPDGLWGPWAIDGSGLTSATPPTDPADGALWWDTESGQLYIWYRDVDSAAWVIASPSPDPALFVQKSGDTMTGMLTLALPPVGDMDAVNKKYLVDAGTALETGIDVKLDGKVSVTGDVMTGPLTVMYASSPTTGQIYFGNSGNQALSYNGNAFIFTSDLYVERRSAPEDGLIFFGNSGNQYIFQHNGTFSFTGNVSANGNIVAGGSLTVVGTSTFTNDITVTRGQQGRPDQGLIWFGNSGNRYFFHDTNSASWVFVGGSLTIDGEGYKPGGGSWANSSDARIKTVLGEYTQGLDAIKQVTPKRYVYKGNDVTGAEAAGVKFPEQKQGGPNPRSQHFTVAEKKKEFIGLVAQDVEGVMPEMVSKTTGKIDGQEVTDYRRLDTNALTYALINAVKELAARVEALEGK